MNIISINNLSDYKIDKKYIRKAALFVLKNENVSNKEISAVFLDSKEIRRLNKQYRNLDRATDVLSFEGMENNFLGEIAIAPEVIKKRSGKDFNRNVAQVLIHGILHLLGYDHSAFRDRKTMRLKEEFLIKEIR